MFNFKMDEEIKESYLYLIKWIMLSVFAGVTGTLIVRSFILLSTSLTSLISSTTLPIWFWPIAGAVIVGGVIYRIQPHTSGEGMPSYIRGIRIHKGELLFSVTFFKYWAALVTLSTFGNGGIVGPLGRVSSGIMSFTIGKIKNLHIIFDKQDQRTAAICGLAATVGAIFHSSIGGGIFAVEIIKRRSMGYKDLFPAILSSSTAVFICKALGWGGFYQFNTIDEFMNIRMIGWLLLLSVMTGLLGGFYTIMYGRISKIFGRKEGNVLLKVVVGSIVSFFIAWAINPELLGTSKSMIPALMSGDLSLLMGKFYSVKSVGFILLVMLFCKILCNCIIVGSGMSAGFTGPVVIAGMLLGSSAAYYLQIETSSPTYYAFLAAGFSGMLASSMNVPLAAAVMTIEIFGLQNSFPAGLAAIIGFQVMRHQTIYSYAIEGYEQEID